MTRLARSAAIASLILFFATGAGATLLASGNPGASRSSSALLVATGFFVVVGSLIISRRPGNSIGWIFCLIGLSWSTGAFAVEYAVFGTTPGKSVPGAWLGAWYGEWNWIPFWILTLVLTPSLFPTGRPLSLRWKNFLVVVVGAATIMTVLVSLDPVLDIEGTDRTIANPIGVAGAMWLDPDIESSLSSILLFPVMFGSAAAAGVSIVLRFRRSRGAERLQIKWFAFSTVLLVLGWFVLGLTGTQGSISVFYGVFVALVPVTAGIAILRYRLFDIDVIINRALVYAVLSAGLLASYLLIVVALSRVLDPVTNDSDLAVAASTLTVAALFRPLRDRIQGFIDRRFYRRKYDATRAVGDFAIRLRDQVDLEVVRSDVLDVVASTLQPRHASLWVRQVSL